jgi:hypothetical protein
MGGHGLYGTVGDYMRFIRMWLNDGADEHGRVLKAKTVRMAEKNHHGDKKVTPITGVIPSLCNDAEFFPIKILGAELHDQRRRSTHRTARRCSRLGWPCQPVLIVRRVRRVLGPSESAVRRSRFVRRLHEFRDGILQWPQTANGRLETERRQTRCCLAS